MYLCKYNSSKKCTGKYNDCVECYKSHSVEIPDNATNGDVIKAICPAWIEYYHNEVELTVKKEWWNAPYKVGDTDGNN